MGTSLGILQCRLDSAPSVTSSFDAATGVTRLAPVTALRPAAMSSFARGAAATLGTASGSTSVFIGLARINGRSYSMRMRIAGGGSEGGALDTAARFIGGAGAVVGAVENLQNGSTGVWLGKNSHFYSTTWGGNEATGGRLAFAGAIADAAHTAGNVIGVAGVGISAVQLGQGIATGNVGQIIQSSFDVGAGAAGFLGPIGWAGSTGYFVGQTIDHFTGASDNFAQWWTGYP